LDGFSFSITGGNPNQRLLGLISGIKIKESTENQQKYETGGYQVGYPVTMLLFS